MNAPETSEKLPYVESVQDEPAVGAESSNLMVQEYAGRTKTNCDGEHIASSIALFTSKSIKELEGLTVELLGLQKFLNSETERVQRDIDNALAGLKVIIDTIAPWMNTRPAGFIQEQRLELRKRLNATVGQK
jgi:hypothetical protein